MTLLRLQSRSLLILTKHQTALVSSRALPLKQVLRPLCINTVKPFPTSTLRFVHITCHSWCCYGNPLFFL